MYIYIYMCVEINECVCDYTVQTPGILRGHKVDECIAQVGTKLHVSWEVKEVIPQGRGR